MQLNAVKMTRKELEMGLKKLGFAPAKAARISGELRRWAVRETVKDDEWRAMSDEQRERRRALGVDRDHACGGVS